MFYDSKNGYKFAGSTAAHDLDVSLNIFRWSFIAIIAVACVASFNGCHGL